MELSKVLEQLRRELVHLDAAIFSLERLQAKAGRRGQPRRAPVEILKAQPKSHPRGRGGWRESTVPGTGERGGKRSSRPAPRRTFGGSPAVQRNLSLQ